MGKIRRCIPDRMVFPVLVLFCTLPSTVSAETKPAKGGAAAPVAAVTTTFRCSADVFYSWKRLPPGPPAPGNPAQPPVDEEYTKPIEVFAEKVAQTLPTEEAGKKAVESILPDALGRAAESCRSQHGEYATCLANAIRSKEGEYRQFDFAARTAFMEGLKKDCERNTGICTGTRAGEISCEKIETQAAPAEEAKGKDEKKKK